uniref:Uncharacterized protein n=1 Tax=Aegilops tauschii TaxID=37682 RepID=M8BE67_AEGTA
MPLHRGLLPRGIGVGVGLDPLEPALRRGAEPKQLAFSAALGVTIGVSTSAATECRLSGQGSIKRDIIINPSEGHRCRVLLHGNLLACYTLQAVGGPRRPTLLHEDAPRKFNQAFELFDPNAFFRRRRSSGERFPVPPLSTSHGIPTPDSSDGHFSFKGSTCAAILIGQAAVVLGLSSNSVLAQDDLVAPAATSEQADVNVTGLRRMRYAYV